MDKLRQKYLQKWLRAQQQPVKKLMRTNIALATLSSLITAQSYAPKDLRQNPSSWAVHHQ